MSEMADEPFSRNELAALRDGSYLAHDFRRALATIATLESRLAAVTAERDKLSAVLSRAAKVLRLFALAPEEPEHAPINALLAEADALLTETATPQREP